MPSVIRGITRVDVSLPPPPTDFLSAYRDGMLGLQGLREYVNYNLVINELARRYQWQSVLSYDSIVTCMPNSFWMLMDAFMDATFRQIGQSQDLTKLNHGISALNRLNQRILDISIAPGNLQDRRYTGLES